MELVYLFLGLTVAFFAIKSIRKSSFFRVVDYPAESISILENYFVDKDFHKNKTMLDLKEKLDIKIISDHSHEKSIKIILDDAKHKSDIFAQHYLKINRSYSDFTTFKVIANSVLTYCNKKNINLKGSIKLLFLTLEAPSLQELFDNKKDDIDLLNSFYHLLEGFVKRYNKMITEQV